MGFLQKIKHWGKKTAASFLSKADVGADFLTKALHYIEDKANALAESPAIGATLKEFGQLPIFEGLSAIDIFNQAKKGTATATSLIGDLQEKLGVKTMNNVTEDNVRLNPSQTIESMEQRVRNALI